MCVLLHQQRCMCLEFSLSVQHADYCGMPCSGGRGAGRGGMAAPMGGGGFGKPSGAPAGNARPTSVPSRGRGAPPY